MVVGSAPISSASSCCLMLGWVCCWPIRPTESKPQQLGYGFASNASRDESRKLSSRSGVKPAKHAGGEWMWSCVQVRCCWWRRGAAAGAIEADAASGGGVARSVSGSSTNASITVGSGQQLQSSLVDDNGDEILRRFWHSLLWLSCMRWCFCRSNLRAKWRSQPGYRHANGLVPLLTHSKSHKSLG